MLTQRNGATAESRQRLLTDDRFGKTERKKKKPKKDIDHEDHEEHEDHEVHEEHDENDDDNEEDDEADGSEGSESRAEGGTTPAEPEDVPHKIVPQDPVPEEDAPMTCRSRDPTAQRPRMVEPHRDKRQACAEGKP